MEADAKECAGQVLVFPAISSPQRFTLAGSLHLGSSVCERCGQAGAHIRSRRLHDLCWFSGRESCCCCCVWEKDRNGGTRKGVRWTSVGVSCNIISASFHALQGARIWEVPYVSAADRRGRISSPFA